MERTERALHCSEDTQLQQREAEGVRGREHTLAQKVTGESLPVLKTKAPSTQRDSRHQTSSGAR